MVCYLSYCDFCIQENKMFCADFDYPQAVNYTLCSVKDKLHIDTFSYRDIVKT